MGILRHCSPLLELEVPIRSWGHLTRRLLAMAILLALTACAQNSPPTTEPQIPTAIAPQPSVTSPPPTPTTVPAAAVVNGRIITVEEYQAELARFEAGETTVGIELATLGDYSLQVLQVLIDRELLLQGAEATGLNLDQESLGEMVQQVSQEAGGEEAFQGWLKENGFTLQSFMEALRKDALASQMIAQISDTVSTTVEQVHARHILLSTREEAEEVRAEIVAGADFENIAWARSLDPGTRLDGGDLGWFPRGFLTQKEVEDAAFSLEPGEISPVIESAFGFHVLEVLGRETRPISPAALQSARRRAVEGWLAEKRASAEIEIRGTP
jgi:peptidyl-prolyl cis-trans isomerase C